MKKAPSEHPIRRRLIAAIGGLFLFLGILYAFVSFSPTGYENLRKEKLKEARGSMPAPESTPPGEAPPSAVKPPPREQNPEPIQSFDMYITSLRVRAQQLLTEDPDLWKVTMQHPLLSWGSIALYPGIASFVPLAGFHPEQWREELAAGMDDAMRGKAAFSDFVPIGGPPPEPPAVDPPARGEAVPPAVPVIRRLADLAEETLAPEKLPPLPEPGSASFGADYDDLARYSILPLVRSILNNDRAQTQVWLDTASMLALLEFRHTGLATPATMLRLEPLVLVAAERDLTTADSLADIQGRLEAARVGPDQVKAARTSYILAETDFILGGGRTLAQAHNAWSYFLDGVPSTLASVVMEPSFQRSVKLYSMALIEGDMHQIEASRKDLDRAVVLMNQEPGQLWALNRFELDRTALLGWAAQRAPHLADQDSDLNLHLDRQILVCAASRHRIERGAWPASPRDLVPDYLAMDNSVHGRHAWRFAELACDACGKSHFVIVEGSYPNQFLWEGSWDARSWNEIQERKAKELAAPPSILMLSSWRNCFCIYEEALRRDLCPGEEEPPTP